MSKLIINNLNTILIEDLNNKELQRAEKIYQLLQYKNLVINQIKNIDNIPRVIATAKNKNIEDIDKFIKDKKYQISRL